MQHVHLGQYGLQLLAQVEGAQAVSVSQQGQRFMRSSLDVAQTLLLFDRFSLPNGRAVIGVDIRGIVLAHGQDQLDVAFGHVGKNGGMAVVDRHGGAAGAEMVRRLLYSAMPGGGFTDGLRLAVQPVQPCPLAAS